MVHVDVIWESDVVSTCTVLILRLEEDDRATICDLFFRYYRRNTLDVVLRSLLVVGVRSS